LGIGDCWSSEHEQGKAGEYSHTKKQGSWARQSANICCESPDPKPVLKPKGRRAGTIRKSEKNTAEWSALARDAKVHQALKCRKLKQAFNETKVPREMRCATGWMLDGWMAGRSLGQID